jgi:hypothetical protein
MLLLLGAVDAAPAIELWPYILLMGYDLSNASGAYVRFTGSGWDLVLAVARHYGWEPAGIPKPTRGTRRRTARGRTSIG